MHHPRFLQRRHRRRRVSLQSDAQTGTQRGAASYAVPPALNQPRQRHLVPRPKNRPVARGVGRQIAAQGSSCASHQRPALTRRVRRRRMARLIRPPAPGRRRSKDGLCGRIGGQPRGSSGMYNMPFLLTK